jgi:hypothetical protein
MRLINSTLLSFPWICGVHPISIRNTNDKVNLFFQGDVTDCKIKTREVEDCADFNFAKANIIRQQNPSIRNSS